MRPVALLRASARYDGDSSRRNGSCAIVGRKVIAGQDSRHVIVSTRPIRSAAPCVPVWLGIGLVCRLRLADGRIPNGCRVAAALHRPETPNPWPVVCRLALQIEPSTPLGSLHAPDDGQVAAKCVPGPCKLQRPTANWTRRRCIQGGKDLAARMQCLGSIQRAHIARHSLFARNNHARKRRCL